MLKEQPRKIIFLYKSDQEIYDSLKKENLVDFFINIEDSTIDEVRSMIKEYKDKDSNGCFGSFLVLDDLLSDLEKSFQTLFTVEAHHYNCSVIFVTQKLHYKNEVYNTISYNTEYQIIMRNKRSNCIKYLAHSIAPHNPQYVTQSFYDATKKPFSYLLSDTSQMSPNTIRLRTNIFPFEGFTIAYVEV